MTQIGHPDRAGQLRQEYLARINRVLDYIETNIDSEFSLETLAEVANFSRFHFHRIFRVMVGETLNRFIQRVRLEKAAGKLIYNPKMSITEIALDCGFSSSATFARAFKDAFHMSASQWRSSGYVEESNIRKTKGKESQMLRNFGKDIKITLHYTDDSTIKQTWRMKMINKSEVQVEVKDMPEHQVAYVRHIGPYQGDGKLFENL
ncbi:MAG: helix-turn-helix transcriptional regulator, partial [bacterium]|nr:helix-turn-helix transcriptional regulator [bacterium]